MANRYHDLEVEGSIHIPNDLTYANQAGRLAASGLTSIHVGRIAKQTDDNSYWVLISESPVTWAPYTAPAPTIGDAGKVLTVEDDGVGNPRTTWETSAASGEANTASNQGTGGVGVFDAKNGVDLEFRNVRSTTNRIGVALDAPNKEIEITLEEGNIPHQDLFGVGTNTHTEIDDHIADTANPHGTDIENLGAGTLAELNDAVTDATLDDSGDPRTPTAHASSHEGGSDAVDVISLTSASGSVSQVLTKGAGSALSWEDGAVSIHNLGGTDHNADTLANLNTKVSDATLDDSGDPRTPTVHASTHESGGSDTIAHQNLSGAGTNAHSAIDSHLGSTTNPHGTDIENLGAGTLAELNDAVTDATLDDSSAARTPIAHDLAGALHNAATLAEINTKVSDATLDDSGDSRTPTAHASTHAGGADAVDVVALTSASGAAGEVLTKGAGSALSWGAGGVPDHNDTTNIQGGTTDEYYHLTSAQHTGTIAHVADVTTNPHVVDMGNIVAGVDSQLVHCDKNRSDTFTPDGTPQRPYLTIQSAINAITDASTSKRYAVLIYPGDYSEDVTMKDYVDLVGVDQLTCRILPTGTTGIDFAATTSDLTNLSVYLSAGTITAHTKLFNISGGLHKIVDCDFYAAKTGGDYKLYIGYITAGSFDLINCKATWSSQGATGTLAQSAFTSITATGVYIDGLRMNALSLDTNTDFHFFATGGGTYLTFRIINTICDLSADNSAGNFSGVYTVGSLAGATVINSSFSIYCPTGNTYGVYLDSLAGSGRTVTSGCVIWSNGGGDSYGGLVGAGDVWVSNFDKINYLDGISTGTGSFTATTSPNTDGDLYVTGDLTDGTEEIAVDEIARKPAVTEVTASTYTILTTDNALDLNRTGIVAVTIDDDNKVDGREIHIADAGNNAQTYNHTVTPETGNIMGETSAAFAADGESWTVYWSASASEWRVR